jgi:hypothetical protein
MRQLERRFVGRRNSRNEQCAQRRSPRTILHEDLVYFLVRRETIVFEGESCGIFSSSTSNRY